MSGPYDLDPDEGRVRSLIRRSDGPVIVRPFRRERARPSALPVMAGAATLLVLGLVVGTSLAVRRQEVASPPVTTGGIVAPTATAANTPAPTATPEPTAAAPGVPASAGAVPDAGILYVLGSDDLIYRYDGGTGAVTAVSGRSMFLHGTPDGALVLGRQGGADLLGWDGSVSVGFCGEGTVIHFSTSRACAYRESDDRVTLSLAGTTDRTPAAPSDWRIGDAVWNHMGSQIALLRLVPGASFEERAHNALWVRDADGGLHQVYEPKESQAYVGSPQWSPDGRWIAVMEFPLVSSSVRADGGALKLIEVASGRVIDLGTTLEPAWISWSPTGELAFIRGSGRETWRNKRLVVWSPDGTERERAVPTAEHVQLAPLWSPSGDLAFVAGPSGADFSGYMDGIGVGDRRGVILRPNGATVEVRCPGGVVEGIQSTSSGRALLLCRAPGDGAHVLSVWFMASVTEMPVPLIRGLGQGNTGTEAGGFGLYGRHPSLNSLAAWWLPAH